MGNIQPSRLNYNGHVISDKGDMLSLTDMWKAAGSPANKEPFNWERFDGRGFIDAVTVAHNLSATQVLIKKAGKGGGTYAHWQIGIAYAKYLDHDFHMWCNTQVRAVMEGKVPTAIPDDVLELIKRTDGIAKMLAHKVTEIEKAIPSMVGEVMEARIAADPRVAVVSYVSVKQILEADYKVPARGRRSIQRKVFVRLSAYCLANGIKAFKCAHSGTWLFPPHEAGAFIREHCSGIIKAHLDRHKGQGSLRLVTA